VDIKALIQQGETAAVEYKIAMPRPAELAARICGFANTSAGGTIIIGVEDKTWKIVGVENVAETIDGILQAVRLCKPPVHLEPAYPRSPN
jgi:predicted HTH transcriptional regulator